MGRDVPWKLGAVKLPPAGLRDCVLRVSFMTPDEVRGAKRDSRHAGMRAAATWRTEQPEQWRELLDVLGIVYEDPKKAPRRRARKRVELRKAVA